MTADSSSKGLTKMGIVNILMHMTALPDPTSLVIRQISGLFVTLALLTFRGCQHYWFTMPVKDRAAPLRENA